MGRVVGVPGVEVALCFLHELDFSWDSWDSSDAMDLSKGEGGRLRFCDMFRELWVVDCRGITKEDVVLAVLGG